jgi:hypothetical protein
MILAKRGFALRISLRNIFIGAILGNFILLPMVTGAAMQNKWTDPVFLIFSLISLCAIAAAVNGIMLLIAKDDRVRLFTAFRSNSFQRSTCRFEIVETGNGRNRTTKVTATDGHVTRTICFYWMLGPLFAARAARRLDGNLL